MKNLPIAAKILFNTILFILYSILLSNIVNFIYDLKLRLNGQVVPFSNDPIHLKIAGIVILFVLIITLILRKYFYISLLKEVKKQKKSTKVKNQKKMKTQGDFEILIDKEIK